MAYKLFKNDIADYNLIAGRAPGSNIAVSGFLDFPKRIEKAFHSWPDEDGVEPWLDSDLQYYGGRDIDFYCLLQAESRADGLNRLETLFADFSAATGLVEFVTNNGTTHNVFQRDEIAVKWLRDGWYQVHIPLTEPVVDLSGDVPEADEGNDLGIDNIHWNTLGIIPLELAGRYKMPKLKDMSFSVYGNQGYEITKSGPKEMTFKGLLNYADMAGLITGTSALYAILTQASLRRIKLEGDSARRFFTTEGFSLSDIRVESNRVTAMLELTMIEDSVLLTFIEGFMASALSTSAIELAWQDATEETAYELQKSTDSETWVSLPDLDADMVAYTDNAVETGATYYYRIRAKNATKVSEWSETIFDQLPFLFAGGQLNIAGRFYLNETFDFT